MATYNELQQRINELGRRTGRASISPSETFGAMGEILDKVKTMDLIGNGIKIEFVHELPAQPDEDTYYFIPL